MKKCYCINPEYKKGAGGGGKVICLKCGGLLLEALVVGDGSGNAQPSLAADGATWESLGAGFIEIEPDHSEGR